MYQLSCEIKTINLKKWRKLTFFAVDGLVDSLVDDFDISLFGSSIVDHALLRHQDWIFVVRSCMISLRNERRSRGENFHVSADIIWSWKQDFPVNDVMNMRDLQWECCNLNNEGAYLLPTANSFWNTGGDFMSRTGIMTTSNASFFGSICKRCSALPISSIEDSISHEEPSRSLSREFSCCWTAGDSWIFQSQSRIYKLP